MRTIILKIFTRPDSNYKDYIKGFDVTSVKVGNLKDPEKIKNKISQAKAIYYTEAERAAPYSPLTGEIMAIVLWDSEKGYSYMVGDEAEILNTFYEYFKGVDIFGSGYIIGWNIKRFDIPFLIKRAWYNRVPFVSLIDRNGNAIPEVIDLKEVWSLNDPENSDTIEQVHKFLTGQSVDLSKLSQSVKKASNIIDQKTAVIDFLNTYITMCKGIWDNMHWTKIRNELEEIFRGLINK